jgi:hypothetical protein
VFFGRVEWTVSLRALTPKPLSSFIANELHYLRHVML